MRVWHMNLLASRLETIFPHASRIHEHEGLPRVHKNAGLAGRTRAAMHSHADDASRAGSWLTDAFDWGRTGGRSIGVISISNEQSTAVPSQAFFSYCLTIARVPHNRVQVIFPGFPTGASWDQTWCAASASTAWILDGHVYHESIIVHPDKQVCLSTPTGHGGHWGALRRSS